MISLKVILICLVVLFVIHTFIIRRFLKIKFWEWYDRSVTSFIPVLFAFVCGIYLFYYQTSYLDGKKMEKYRVLLKSEISATLQMLDWNKTNSSNIYTFHTDENGKLRALLVHMDSTILEDAVRSGLFSNVNTDKMFDIMTAIHMYNYEADNIINYIDSPANSKYVSDFPTMIINLGQLRSDLFAKLKEFVETIPDLS